MGQMAEKYEHEMPAMLRQAGYYTIGIGKQHFHPQRNSHGYHRMILDESGRNFSPDFRSDYRSWFWSLAPTLDPDATGIGWNDYRPGAYALPENLHPTRWTADTAVNFLKEYQGKEPFFLMVSFARPHSPYDPPDRFMRMYENADVPPPPSATGRTETGGKLIRRTIASGAATSAPNRCELPEEPTTARSAPSTSRSDGCWRR